MQLACTLAIRVCWIMKSMNNVIVGGYIVRRGVNPLTSVLEYSIKELGNGVQVDEAEPEMWHVIYVKYGITVAEVALRMRKLCHLFVHTGRFRGPLLRKGRSGKK
ncbi:hypothetical protein L3X38_000203 (mitochondrion) [Prunus dulcis]|uniref:PTC1-like winged helix-turn-helix domain-containing protein n=1 Tax=Prunus dulcis TaxID=3755 RepID=A0AAD4UTE2_PRUDU|nr:hypothetical protein L3X38_000203 [Prunus dulcis]